MTWISENISSSLLFRDNPIWHVLDSNFYTQKFCLLEQELSCKLPRQEMHSWSMFFPHQLLNHLIVKPLPSIRNLRTCLKNRMLTPYRSILHMIAPLILKMEHNLHSDQSTTYHKTNLHLFTSTMMKTLRRGSFDIPSLQLVA